MPSTTLTITRNIVNLSPVGNNVWRIEFNPSQTKLTNTDVSDPVIYYSSSALPVILNPFLNNLGNWNSNEYNAIINNAVENRLNTKLQEVDYATSQNIPVNIIAILSGSAYPASVPDSNYTSLWWNEPRYLGSKNTTDNFNSALTSQSLVVQTYQNDNIGATTLGYPSVNNFDTGIYEFAWGGGTYPEIAGGGAVKLSQILNVDNTSSVGIISPLTNFFGTIVQSNIIPNSQPQFTQYSTTANIPNTARVITAEFGVPTISNYMIAVGSDFEAIITANNANVTFSNSASLVTTNTSGFYISGSAISGSDMIFNISSSLSEGERWFMSYYSNMRSPVSGTLLPVNLGYSSSLSDGSYVNPLTVNGVYEITSAGVASSNSFTINPLPRQGLVAGDTAGILIWKAITDNTFILFNQATLSGVGKGNIITQNASPIIKNNLQSITTTFGTN